MLTMACSEPPQGELPRAEPLPDVTARPMLPAFPMAGERNGSGKADQYSDFRYSNDWAYGITQAPRTPMRAVGQWADHQQLLLAWTGQFPETIAGIVAGARSRIQITVVHEGGSARQQFKNAMSQYGVSTAGIEYADMAIDSIWMRDYGPLSVRAPDGTVSFVDPRYYHQRIYDDVTPTLLGQRMGINVYRQPLSWEGGTYIADGEGNCYYTNGVYQYNALSQSRIHQYQRDYMGCETNTVTYPLLDEGTTHSDMFSKLVARDHMLIGSYTSAQDAGNRQLLDKNAQIVAASVRNDGTYPQVTRIPMPHNDGRQVWRTYANSLFVNGVNLVPVYSDDRAYEDAAMAVWQSAMPNWQHVKVDSTGLITWSGAVHCITMTVPQGRLAAAEASPSMLCNGDYSCHPANTGAGSCSLGFAGCCDGNTLQTCGANGPTSQACPQGCGWNSATNSYACGGSGAGPASAPMACGASSVTLPPQPSTPPSTPTTQPVGGCQGVTHTGCCAGDTLKYCQSGELRSQACSGCGWDAAGNNGHGWYDCGGDGTDPSGEHVLACPGSEPTAPSTPTTTTPATPPPSPAATSGCGDMGWEGCCSGSVLRWCENNEVKTLDCETASCGWNSSAAYYDCNQAGHGPADFPMVCSE